MTVDSKKQEINEILMKIPTKFVMLNIKYQRISWSSAILKKRNKAMQNLFIPHSNPSEFV